MHELTRELNHYKWDISLEEIRRKNSGELITDEGHKIVYSGKQKLHQQGVTFIMRKEMISVILQASIYKLILHLIRVTYL